MFSESNVAALISGRRRFLQFSAGGVAIAALGLTMGPDAQAAGVVRITQKIVTGHMIHKPGWPKYEPASFTVPAHSIIEVTVRCYDDGNAEIPVGYEKVRGTIGGTMRLIKGTPKVIAPDAGKIVSAIPVKDVAHTFTVNGDNFFMNVPMPVLGTVVYRFKTPGPGKYPWQCMAACGTGKGGWAGPMVKDGWMEGIITVS